MAKPILHNDDGEKIFVDPARVTHFGKNGTASGTDVGTTGGLAFHCREEPEQVAALLGWL